MKLSEIAKAISGKLYGADVEIDSYTIDSRDIGNNSLFIPLRGENADGHSFIDSFFENDGIACLSEKVLAGKDYILVENTKQALIDLAKYYRGKFTFPVVAITGSVGKTSTRNMIASVLYVKYNIAQTIGNFNNEIGLPLSILNGINNDTQVGVFEIGMNHLGEIDFLSDILKPDYAIITNIGTAHIGNLGSQENILKAKFEVFNHISLTGTGIINADDKLLYDNKSKIPCRTLTYGIENYLADVKTADIVGTLSGYKFIVDDYTYDLNLLGKHNIYNALSAITIAKDFGLTDDQIQTGFNNLSSVSGRQDVIDLGDFVLIDDCYNASKDSMIASLDLLYKLGKGKKKIAVLGSMLELGEFSDTLHREVGEHVKDIDLLVTVGTEAEKIAEKAEATNIIKVGTADAVIENLTDLTGSVILLKGSHGIGLQKVADKLKEK